jgi:hypothetical protein
VHSCCKPWNSKRKNGVTWAAGICRQEWLARSRSTEQRKLSQAELRDLNQNKLDEICEYLDELSSHWSSLEVGESMAVRWPDLEIVAAQAALPEIRQDLQN